jgi:nucleoside-diphosphate-sugar epimerase
MERTGIANPCLVTLGHGYSARALAASLGPGWRVVGTTRSAEKADALRRDGVAPVLWDDAVAVGEAIDAATHLLVSLAPDAEGCPALGAHREAIKAARRLVWVGYLSTTGVYGDRDGAWVDERAPLAPVNARSRWRVEAEEAWLALGRERPVAVQVFRLAGIYGPGRSALDRLREGRAQRIVKAGQVFSRIHVEDIAQVLRASMASPNPGAVYNVADDEPAPPQDVIAYAADLLGLTPPPEIPFEAADLSPMARSFYAESKRVANARIKEELGVRLRYPDYRAGLAAILADGG